MCVCMYMRGELNCERQEKDVIYFTLDAKEIEKTFLLTCVFIKNEKRNKRHYSWINQNLKGNGKLKKVNALA